MYCTKCGSQIEENQRFCPNCGAEQKNQNNQNNQGEGSPQAKPERKPEPAPVRSEATAKKGGNKKKGVGIFAAAAVVVFAAGGFWLMKNANSYVYVKDNAAYLKEGVLEKKDSLKKIEIPEGALRIAEGAFSGCINLETAVLPETVTEIGEQAFLDCGKLNDVNLEQVKEIGEQAFKNCTSLNVAELPDELSLLGKEAFAGTAIEYAEIPAGLKGNGFYAFMDAFEGTPYYDSMERISLHEISEMTREEYKAKHYVFHIYNDDYRMWSVDDADISNEKTSTDQKIEMILSDARCYGVSDNGMYYTINSQDEAEFLLKDREMSRVEIPEYIYSDQKIYTVKGIKPLALYNSSDVEEIVMSDEVCSIGGYAFYGTSIKKIENFPAQLAVLGNHALPRLTEQTELVLPQSLKSIGKECFQGLNVEAFELPDGITKIQEGTFSESLIRTITIPETVTTIGEQAFLDCTNLEKIDIPDTVTEIGKQAFSGCTNLTEVKLPDNPELTEIEKYTFSGCSNLAAINIPDSVSLIKKDAFFDCEKLAYILVANNSVMCEWEAYEEPSVITQSMMSSYRVLHYNEYEPDEALKKVVNCEESITLRTSPSTAAEEICQIPLGVTVNYIEDAGGEFYRVEYNGKTGYALAYYLEDFAYYTPLTDCMQVVNCNESITLRTESSTSAEEICQIPLGSYVYVVGSRAEEKFAEVVYNGERGYVLAEYLTPYVGEEIYEPKVMKFVDKEGYIPYSEYLYWDENDGSGFEPGSEVICLGDASPDYYCVHYAFTWAGRVYVRKEYLTQ